MSASNRAVRYARVWTDTLVYALALALVATLLALIAGVGSGGGAVRGKQLLFLVGWVIIAYATAKLWPTSPDDVSDPEKRRQGRSVPGGSSTRFEEFVGKLPPLRWMEPPLPEDRTSVEAKLFLAGCFTLLSSFVMEVQFGVV